MRAGIPGPRFITAACNKSVARRAAPKNGDGKAP